MNCSDIDHLVSECEELDAAASHVAKCANCQRMLDLLATPLTVPFDEEARRGPFRRGSPRGFGRRRYWPPALRW